MCLGHSLAYGKGSVIHMAAITVVTIFTAIVTTIY